MPKKKRREPEEASKEPPLPGEGTVICGVIRHLGGDFLLAKCLDGVDRKIHLAFSPEIISIGLTRCCRIHHHRTS